MQRILIFGNSGSGKSTLAKRICEQNQLAHLDLDTLAWEKTTLKDGPPKRSSIEKSNLAIQEFINENRSWVIEGCYSDLLFLLKDKATEIIFMNLPVELCIDNAKQRPWEPHKYENKAAQDANLAMLCDWIADYDNRDDEFSKTSHEKFYAEFNGQKKMITANSSI